MRSVFSDIILLFLLVVFIATGCRSSNEVVKRPDIGGPTEFHREPVFLIPELYMSFNDRGVDRSEDVDWHDTIGFGAGLYINQPMSSQWMGHKFMYYYVDFEASSELIGPGYPGEKNWVFSTYPGVMFRSYLPLLFKVHYGLGLNIRAGSTPYGHTGVYGKMGLEFYGLTASTIFIGHPGQSAWETEYRVGWMYAPIN